MQVSGHRGSDKPNVFSATGTSASITAGRFSYALGLIGPCYSVDTACSSALAALHICANTVTVQRECTHGLAIGCSSLSEVLNMATSVAGMLSLRGRCHTFDERADGYCRGEGCAAFSVMSRNNAKNGPSVSILGSAVQQDGPSASLTAPNGSSQTRLIETVSNEIGTNMDRDPNLEAHGTGTALGDPIEVSIITEHLLNMRFNYHPGRRRNSGAII